MTHKSFSIFFIYLNILCHSLIKIICTLHLIIFHLMLNKKMGVSHFFILFCFYYLFYICFFIILYICFFLSKSSLLHQHNLLGLLGLLDFLGLLDNDFGFLDGFLGGFLDLDLDFLDCLLDGFVCGL